MQEVPWFALSPSPFTIAFYLILTVYGMKQLLKRVEYKRLSHLLAFTDAIFILGLIVLTTDTLWIIASGLRFGWLYPDSVLQLVFSIGRNIAGITLCYFLVGNYFKKEILQFSEATWTMLFVNAFFMLGWFLIAQNPSFTDWTFAIRYDYPLSQVIGSFLVSHVIGKTLVAITYLSMWQKP